MSIYTLQRKSRRFQAPISSEAYGGHIGFSLNGGIRNNRPVGQTNLMSLKAETLACSGNDAQIPKGSTKNTLGYLYDTVYYPVKCGVAVACKPVVKGVTGVLKSGSISGEQSDYIKNRAWVVSNASCNPAKKNDAGCKADCSATSVRQIGGRNIKIGNYVKNVKNKLAGASTVGEDLRTGAWRRRGLPTPANVAHFPMALLNQECGRNAVTPAQAIALGLLPADWKDGCNQII